MPAIGDEYVEPTSSRKFAFRPANRTSVLCQLFYTSRRKPRNSELLVHSGKYRRLYQTSTRRELCINVRCAQIPTISTQSRQPKVKRRPKGAPGPYQTPSPSGVSRISVDRLSGGDRRAICTNSGVTYGVNTAFPGSILVANSTLDSTLNQIVHAAPVARVAGARVARLAAAAGAFACLISQSQSVAR